MTTGNTLCYFTTMKIERLGRLNTPLHTLEGHTLSLEICGKIVHSEKITCERIISCWALVSAGKSLGYFIGDDDLEKDLS